MIFGVLVVVAAIMVVVVIPAGSSAGMARLMTVAVAVVLLLIGVVRPVLRWKTTTYELTTARLRLREGIVSRTGRDIPLARISDVSFSRSLLDRLLGAGRLLVESPGEHGQIVLSDIPASNGFRPSCSGWSRRSSAVSRVKIADPAVRRLRPPHVTRRRN